MAVAPAPVVETESKQSRTRKKLALFGTPIFIITVLLATYLWISSLELDSIEMRVLNKEVLTESLMEHLYLTGISTALVILIAIPLGILVTRPSLKRATPFVLGLANAGQAIPSFGLLTIVVIWFGIGVQGVIFGLVAYSTLPILRNTMVGIQQVDKSLIKAARGMGMSSRQVLARVEMPLAVPVMLAGIRTALIINVGTATLATFFGAGGLGFVIFNGIQLNRDPVLVTGVVMVSALALTVDYLAGVIGRLASPRGL